MSGLDNILNGIKADSDDVICEMINGADERAEAIISEAKEAAEQILKQEEQKALSEAEAVIKRAKSGAEMNAKKFLMSEKRRLVYETLELVRKKLNSLSGEGYFKALKSIIEKNKREEQGEVILTKSDCENMPESFKLFLENAGLSVSEKYLSADRKGCIMIYSNADENCTFDGLLEANYEELSDKAQKLLFD